MAIRPVALAVLAAPVLLFGCVTENVGISGDSGSSTASIRRRIADFESLQPGQKEYDDNLSILSGLLKEKSYPLLVEALEGDPNPRIRVSVALCLGLGQEDRARDVLHRAATGDENPGVRYTAAYSLCTFRDSRGLPVLFEALKAENAQVRWDANDRLKRLTRLDFAFDASASAEDRAAAVGRWEGWYRQVGPSGASQALMPPAGKLP